MSLMDKIRDAWIGSRPQTNPSSASTPAALTWRVLQIIHNPTVRSERGRKLTHILNWHDPDDLAHRFSEDVRHASYGYVNFRVVERIEVDGLPVKADGFQYDSDTFLMRWRTRTGFHQPDRVDYQRILNDFNIIPRINLDQIDEVWLFAPPYAGYYESMMVGPGAFWCNAPALPVRGRVAKRFVVMGFNYERGVGEMLENLGHRAESILKQVFRSKRGEADLWSRFIRYDKSHPGQAECGNVHFAPNSERDYDWGNPRPVLSKCDDWYNFPHFQGVAKKVSGRDWGNGDIRQHHLWWMRHFPHVTGSTSGISHNWWEYIIDPNRVK